MRPTFSPYRIFYFRLLQFKLGDHSEDVRNMHGVSGKNGQVIKVISARRHQNICVYFHDLPPDKILGLSTLKAVDKFTLAQMVYFFFERVINIEGNGKNAGFQQFFLFPHFLRFFFHRLQYLVLTICNTWHFKTQG